MIWTFYRNFCLASLLTTAVGAFLAWEYGSGTFLVLVVLKAVVLYILYSYIKRYKNAEFFYYRNLGLSKIVLWSTTFTFDIALYVLLITQIGRIR